MPSGKSLADLIIFFNTPPTPTCSHSDYNTIKTERDNYKNQWDTHTCPAINCPQSCCQGDYERLQQKLATQKQQILQQINQALGLGLENQELSLKKIITRLEELLRSPLIELAQAKKTIKLLKKQLAKKDPNYQNIQQAEYQKLLQLVKKDTLQNCEKLGIVVPRLIQENIEKATTLEMVMREKNKLIRGRFAKSEEELKSLTYQKSQLVQERWIWGGFLLLGYLIIVGLLVKLNGRKKVK